MNELFVQILSYLQGIWRHRWYALGLAWLICLGAWAVIYKLPNQFQASARVYVDTQSVLRPLLQGMTVQFNPEAQIGLMSRTLLSRPNLEKVARMTDLDLKAKDSAGMDKLLNDIARDISLQTAGRENLYSISYTENDPELAKKVVQSLLTIFVENTLGETRQDTDTAQRFLERQISDYEARLLASEQRLVEFKRRNFGMIPGSEGDYYAQLKMTAGEFETIKLELQQAENRRDSLRQQLEGEQPTVGFGNVPSAVTVTLPIDARINSLQEQLDNLLIKYTEKHPEVRVLQATITDLQQQREKDLTDYMSKLKGDATASASLGDNPVYQQLKLNFSQEEGNISALRARLTAYQQRLQELQNKLNTVPEVEAQLKALDRDYSVNRSNYEALVARREQARLSQQAEQTTDDIRFRVIDPPRVPVEPSGPNRPLLMTAALGAGIGSGLSLAFLIAQLWPVFDDRRQLAQATNLPVFGAVSAVLPATALRAERIRLIFFFILLALLFLVFGTMLIGYVTRLLPL